MALPLALAVPALTGFVVNGIAGLAGFFAAYIGKKTAVIAAFTVAFVGGWVALQAAAYATWTALSWSSPPFMQEVFTVVLTLLPDMWLPAINAIVVMRIAQWLWRVQKAWMVFAGNV